MSEQVQTGGVMQFNYSKNDKMELDDERKNFIRAGYDEYEERKRRDRRNMIAFIILLVLVIIIASIYLLSRN